MANLTSEQANQLSDDFFYLGMAIGLEGKSRMNLTKLKSLH